MVVNTDNDTFTYTHEYEVDNSSLIEVVYYNANDRSAVIDVNDEWYRYTNVDKADVERLVNGEDENGSVGAHYNRHFKPRFGPGEHLGSWWGWDAVSEDEVPVTTYVTGDVVKAGTVIARSNEPTKEYSLQPVPEKPAVTDNGVAGVIIEFTLDGIEGKTFTFDALSVTVEDAIEELHNYVSRIGTTGKVVKAVINFD
jgi:hypothetical protein